MSDRRHFGALISYAGSANMSSSISPLDYLSYYSLDSTLTVIFVIQPSLKIERSINLMNFWQKINK